MSLTDQEDQGVTADTPAASTTDVTAATSTATDTPEPSFTDVVLKALEPKEESPPSTDEPGSEAAKAASQPTGTEPDAKAAAEAGDPEDKHALTPDEEKALKPKTKERIDYLLGQRNELREQMTARDREIEALKPEAESYRKVTAFMRENNLTAQDAGQALRLAGLIQTDPMAAFEMLRPIVQELAQKTGALMPQDLAEDVRLGRITQARAQELAQARARSTLAQNQQQKATERQAERQREEEAARQRDAQANHLRGLATAGDELAALRAQSDPDWKSKEPLVADKLKLDIAQNGIPKDKADLEKRFNAIVTDVTKYLIGLGVQRPKPTTLPPASVSSTGLDNRPPPANAQEAVLRALGE